MKYQIQGPGGELLVNNLELPCQECLKKCNSQGKLNYDCGLDGKPKRNGIISGKRGTSFLCCGETKTTKLFKEKLLNIQYAIPGFQEIKQRAYKEAALEEYKKYKRLVHNLKTLNGQTIQELFNLVPQEYISANIKEQFDLIRDTISENLDQCVRTFIRIAKHHSHMKAELAIQDKLMDETSVIQKRPHVIRKVLMNVLHTFFIDFEEKEVQVTVNTNYTQIFVDYESVHVALYHLIHNASKYIRPRSILRITFTENDFLLTIDFEMESLYIAPNEIDLIFQEGYSGINPQNAGFAGEGIGMGRIKSLINLNGADFTVHPGRKYTSMGELNYALNLFRLVFKKQKISSY